MSTIQKLKILTCLDLSNSENFCRLLSAVMSQPEVQDCTVTSVGVVIKKGYVYICYNTTTQQVKIDILCPK